MISKIIYFSYFVDFHVSVLESVLRLLHAILQPLYDLSSPSLSIFQSISFFSIISSIFFNRFLERGGGFKVFGDTVLAFFLSGISVFGKKIIRYFGIQNTAGDGKLTVICSVFRYLLNKLRYFGKFQLFLNCFSWDKLQKIAPAALCTFFKIREFKLRCYTPISVAIVISERDI